MEYKKNSKKKFQECAKFLADKKALIKIIFGQCDEATKTKIVLKTIYAAGRQAGKLIKFLNRLRTVSFGHDDSGLSYGPYKQVIAVKLMNSYTNNKSNNPHDFKEQVKIKYKVTKAVAGNSPNGTAALMELLSRTQLAALDWAGYCTLTPDKQLVWGQRDNELNQSMLYLMNSKNKLAKKDLRLAYFERNNTAYPPNIESMARYLSTPYSNNKPANQRGGKRKIKRRAMTQNFKTRIVIGVALLVNTLKLLQQLKNPLLLAKELA